ncbi:FkbM family methyltransferase [Nitratidesulfovibrio sp. D1]|uniref:FkbM family methyltransferase n=1 Tax=Nitratidesulfovibrio sp. D1 TaxID=3440151 RepID=UPI003EBE2D1B
MIPLSAQLIQMQFQSLKQALDNDRFTPKRISCLDYEIGIVDGKSFVYQFRDIFVDQVYRFDAGTDAPVIVDCGANVGLSCLYFKRLYPLAKIVAFEADRKIARHLESNLSRNGAADVRVQQAACWVHARGVDFLADGADGGHIAPTPGAEASGTGAASTPSVRLRDMLARMPRIHMLKMDIEGAETEVLPDCRDVLARVDHLFFEYHSWLGVPQSLGELLALLRDCGFRYYIQDVGPRHSPFVNRALHDGFDMQLNVFAYR